MASLARADLESLLRAKQLDRTLTTTMAEAPPVDDVVPVRVVPLDEALGGGFPRGQLSELVGPASSGRTTVLLQTLAAATARGELVALVDALDTFDVESAAAAGIDLDRLLWIRGHVVPNPGLCRELNHRALEQVLRALALILQSGHFGVVAFDVAGLPPETLRRLPFTTWLRVQRMVEGRQTACLLIGTAPMARSSAGATVKLTRVVDDRAVAGSSQRSSALPAHARLFDGLSIEAQVVRARVQSHASRPVPFATTSVESHAVCRSVRAAGR